MLSILEQIKPFNKYDKNDDFFISENFVLFCKNGKKHYQSYSYVRKFVFCLVEGRIQACAGSDRSPQNNKPVL